MPPLDHDDTQASHTGHHVIVRTSSVQANAHVRMCVQSMCVRAHNLCRCVHTCTRAEHLAHMQSRTRVLHPVQCVRERKEMLAITHTPVLDHRDLSCTAARTRRCVHACARSSICLVGVCACLQSFSQSARNKRTCSPLCMCTPCATLRKRVLTRTHVQACVRVHVYPRTCARVGVRALEVFSRTCEEQ